MLDAASNCSTVNSKQIWTGDCVQVPATLARSSTGRDLSKAIAVETVSGAQEQAAVADVELLLDELLSDALQGDDGVSIGEGQHGQGCGDAVSPGGGDGRAGARSPMWGSRWMLPVYMNSSISFRASTSAASTSIWAMRDSAHPFVNMTRNGALQAAWRASSDQRIAPGPWIALITHQNEAMRVDDLPVGHERHYEAIERRDARPVCVGYVPSDSNALLTRGCKTRLSDDDESASTTASLDRQQWC